MLRTSRWFALLLIPAALVYLAGCGKAPDAAGPSAAHNVPASPLEKRAEGQRGAETKKAPDEEHGHKPGAHGGILVSLGRDSYHAEAVFEKGGILRLHMLGKDEAKVQEVDTQTLTGYVKPEGAAEASSFILKAAPVADDTAGKTSQFIGNLPRDLWGQKLEVTIPSIRVAGERFRLGFKSVNEEQHGGDPMPTKVAAEDEKKLYLTPGGKYTDADIKANGNMSASQKFKGLRAEHDLKPKSGDQICPITLTKANSKFNWVVGGKTYEFCCPPCVDEFVQTAKDKPDEIKEPGDYVKK